MGTRPPLVEGRWDRLTAPVPSAPLAAVQGLPGGLLPGAARGTNVVGSMANEATGIETTRLDAFSDGVLAIAVTRLLEVRVAPGDAPARSVDT